MEERFHNIYNPAYQVSIDGSIKHIDLDPDYDSWCHDYQSYDRQTYYRHSELLTRKQAVETSIDILEKRLIELRLELDET